jgi:hypothetical protein
LFRGKEGNVRLINEFVIDIFKIKKIEIKVITFELFPTNDDKNVYS